MGQVRKASTFKWLGYTPRELNEYLSAWIYKFCEDCAKTIITPEASHIDHILPQTLAATERDVWKSFQLRNLRRICGPCNIKKGDSVAADFGSKPIARAAIERLGRKGLEP